MGVIYSTKYPLKQIIFSLLIVFTILFYIFWGVFHFTVIIAIGIISIYLISITMIPIFILNEDSFSRFYFLKPFNAEYIYKLNDIQKIEIKQNRQGYQAFPTMKVFFKENNKERKHLFHFIKGAQEDFDNLIAEAQNKKIDIRLLSGN